MHIEVVYHGEHHTRNIQDVLKLRFEGNTVTVFTPREQAVFPLDALDLLVPTFERRTQ